jgi:hypothetical protein
VRKEAAVEFPSWMMFVVVAVVAILAVAALYKFTRRVD